MWKRIEGGNATRVHEILKSIARHYLPKTHFYDRCSLFLKDLNENRSLNYCDEKYFKYQINKNMLINYLSPLLFSKVLKQN